MSMIERKQRRNMTVAWTRKLGVGQREVSLFLAVAFAGAFSVLQVRAQAPYMTQNPTGRPELLRDVGIDQKLDQGIPLELTFHDETGRNVKLGDYFGRKPVILTLVYYQCPMLCTQVLNGQLRAMKNISLDLGRDYDAVTVSIDPSERPVLADAKKIMYAGLYGRPTGMQGWHFLTGSQESITPLARAAGFRYAYDKASGQFAHASVIMVLTPQGKLSRYFYGIQYASRDLRLALVEASAGKIGSPVDQLLLFCYHYDPVTGKYGLAIANVIRAAGAITVLGIGIMMLVFFRRENYRLEKR
jgi:protein SCO1/2